MSLSQNWQNVALSVGVCVALLIFIYAIRKLFQLREIRKGNKKLHLLTYLSFILLFFFICLLYLTLTQTIEPVYYFVVISALITAVFVSFAIQTHNEMAVSLTKSKALEHYYATHDDLTGLPNLAFFNDQLEKTLGVSRREDDEFALLFIGLNRFKLIN